MTHTLRIAHSPMEPETVVTSIDEMADKDLFATEQHPAISVAHSYQDLESAYRLVYDQYLKQGYQVENENRVRFTPHFGLPTSHTLIAKTGDSVIGVLTMVVDGALGLPMEKQYPQEIEALRRSGAKIAEISCLVTRRSKDLPVLLRLFYAAYAYATKHLGVTDFCVAVTTGHRRFYKQALLFEQIGDVTAYNSCNDVRAVAMRLNLSTAQQCFQNTHSIRRMLGRFFLNKENIQQIGRQMETPTREDLLTRYAFTRRHLNLVTLDADTAQRIAMAFEDALMGNKEENPFCHLKTA